VSEHSVYREFLWRAPETGLHPAISDVPPPASLIDGSSPWGFRVEGAGVSVGELSGTSSWAFTPTATAHSTGPITGTSSWSFTVSGATTLSGTSSLTVTVTGAGTGAVIGVLAGTSTWAVTGSGAMFNPTVFASGHSRWTFLTSGSANDAIAGSVPWGWRVEGDLTNTALTGTATISFTPTGDVEDGGVALRLGLSTWTFTPSGALIDTGFVPPRSGSLDAARIPGPRGEELAIVEIAPWLLKALAIVEAGDAVGDLGGGRITLDSTAYTLDDTGITLDQTEVATP